MKFQILQGKKWFVSVTHTIQLKLKHFSWLKTNFLSPIAFATIKKLFLPKTLKTLTQLLPKFHLICVNFRHQSSRYFAFVFQFNVIENVKRKIVMNNYRILHKFCASHPFDSLTDFQLLPHPLCIFNKKQKLFNFSCLNCFVFMVEMGSIIQVTREKILQSVYPGLHLNVNIKSDDVQKKSFETENLQKLQEEEKLLIWEAPREKKRIFRRLFTSELNKWVKASVN